MRKLLDKQNHTPFDLGERQFADSMLVKFGSYKERARFQNIFKPVKEKQNPAAEQVQPRVALLSNSLGKTSL